jgi:hypothetical protein
MKLASHLILGLLLSGPNLVFTLVFPALLCVKSDLLVSKVLCVFACVRNS